MQYSLGSVALLRNRLKGKGPEIGSRKSDLPAIASCAAQASRAGVGKGKERTGSRSPEEGSGDLGVGSQQGQMADDSKGKGESGKL